MILLREGSQGTPHEHYEELPCSPTPNKFYTLGGSQLRGSTKSELSTNYNIPHEDLAWVPHTKPRKIWSRNKNMIQFLLILLL